MCTKHTTQYCDLLFFKYMSASTIVDTIYGRFIKIYYIKCTYAQA